METMGRQRRKNNYKTIVVVGGKMRGSDITPDQESMRRGEWRMRRRLRVERWKGKEIYKIHYDINIYNIIDC